MLPKPSQQPVSPRLKANPLSILVFAWIIPFFVKGYHKDLTHEDVYRVLPEDETKYLTDKMEAAWLAEVAKSESKSKNSHSIKDGEGDTSKRSRKRRQPSLTKALIRVFGPTMSFYGVFAFIEECGIKILNPIMLGFLLDYFNNPKNFGPYDGYIYTAAIIGLSLMYTSMDHFFTFSVQHLGMKTRISLCSLIYRKSLRVSKYAMEQTPAGQITNFLSSDMNRFDILFTFFHYMWVGPIQLCLVIAVLYFYVGLGFASLTGLLLIFLFVPFQGFMGYLFSKLRCQTVTTTDERLLALEEILTAIRVIKMYTWEKPYCDIVSETRKAEVRMLRKTAMCRALNQSIFAVTSRAVLFITLLVCILSGDVLTAKKVYMTVELYNSVQTVMTLFFPCAIIATAETLVSLERIKKFLLMEEKVVPKATQDGKYQADRVRKYDYSLVSPDDQRSLSTQYTFTTRSFETTSFGDVGVWAHNISAKWNLQMKEFSFRNVTFDVKGGEILAIVGPTASGKSSILNSLLYELPLERGEFKTVGLLAYSCQEPWVFNGSVRENILFGKPYNASWYDEVTEACALTRDFQQLSFGDRTLVGEKGSELSGGQKARVTLARAAYADADIYLLDDPLSAVDAQVGRHIVEKCILGLLRNKCRILVTHQLQHIKCVDKVLVMVDGHVAHAGDYKSLQQSGIPFSELLNPPQDTGNSTRKVHENSPSFGSLVKKESSLFTCGIGGLNSDKAPNLDPVPVQVRDIVLDEPEVAEESVTRGGIGLKTVCRYFSAGSSFSCILFLMSVYILSQVVYTGGDLYLQYWVSTESTIAAGTLVYSNNQILHRIQESRLVRIAIYSGLICVLFLLFLMKAQIFFRRCMKSSVVIYEQLFHGVMRSPISFFERVPTGRILNRFAKDISIIDENLPQSMYDVTETFIQTLGIITLIIANTFMMIIPSCVLILILYLLRKFYFRTALSTKRLEGVARSPIFNHLTTTLLGLPTIRAFGVEEKFMRDFEDIHDVHNSCWYMFLSGTRWLGVAVDWIVISFVCGVSLDFLLNLNIANDSVVGVSLTSAMGLTSMLQWGMRQSAEMENHLIAFERVKEYCELPPEAALESEPDKKPSPSWPYTGEIKIQNLCLRYNENNATTMVLKNISCTINGGEKVGIVGRTGAGKSSLISVLFRLTEPTSGYIEIDGIETTSIGLYDLRSKISIIPQEPVIFSGTIRSNLDPISEFTDVQIWDALQEVHLTETVKLIDGGLDCEISEGGSNFSSGQKQLACLARCILKKNKILVLDEASSNCDPATDNLIQKTIRRNFGECTVLTIAHRLHTVMDSDRILVLNAGQIMEFDEPQVLLANRHSMLYNLVQQTGKAEASNLSQIARIAALRRRQLQECASKDSPRNSRSPKSSSFTTVGPEVDEFIL